MYSYHSILECCHIYRTQVECKIVCFISQVWCLLQNLSNVVSFQVVHIAMRVVQWIILHGIALCDAPLFICLQLHLSMKNEVTC